MLLIFHECPFFFFGLVPGPTQDPTLYRVTMNLLAVTVSFLFGGGLESFKEYWSDIYRVPFNLSLLDIILMIKLGFRKTQM